MRRIFPIQAWMLLSALLIGCTHDKQPTTQPLAPAPSPNQQTASASRAHATTQSAKLADLKGNYHLHLPGIGGYRNIDRRAIAGLRDGDLDGVIDHYDWTVADPGLGALLARKRNGDEALNVAQIILERRRADPNARITLTAHSGGCGILAWALEHLPDDVSVDSVAFLSPALSPTYDLSKALRHVKKNAYVIYSSHDVAVLGIGTSLFGTIDGIKTEAAGKVGFVEPKNADPAQYAKLHQFPYDRSWMKLDNIGDHIGSLSRPFIRDIVAPLLTQGRLPATQPTTN